MSSQTPRLQLIMPDDPESQDIDVLNANFARIDKYSSTLECTSTTRPAAGDRFVGLQIYETDTGCILIWDGSNWKQVSAKRLSAGGNGFTAASGWIGSSEAGLEGDWLEMPGRWLSNIKLRNNTGTPIVVTSGNGLISGAPITVANCTSTAMIAALGLLNNPILPFAFQYRTTSGGTRMGGGRLFGGAVQLISGQPGGNDIQAYASGSGEYSVAITVEIPRLGAP